MPSLPRAETRTRSSPHLIGGGGYGALLVALVLGLVVALVAGISIGTVTLPVKEVWSVVGHHLGVLSAAPTKVQDQIVWDFRTPRVLLAAVVAADQAGIETSLIETLLTTLAAITVAAIALAFALGSRASFHNLVAGHFMRRLIRPGDSLKLDAVEGVVVRYFGVCVVVRTATGEVTLPCKVLLDHNLGLSRMGAKARAQRDGAVEVDAGDDAPG